MENAFDALCSALAEPELKEMFLESEGVELMVICMKEKKLSRSRSIKVRPALARRGNCESVLTAPLAVSRRSSTTPSADRRARATASASSRPSVSKRSLPPSSVASLFSPTASVR